MSKMSQLTCLPIALIGIAHPLEMTAEMRSEFAQLFADYEIMPPFASWHDARCCSHLTSQPVIV